MGANPSVTLLIIKFDNKISPILTHESGVYFNFVSHVSNNNLT